MMVMFPLRVFARSLFIAFFMDMMPPAHLSIDLPDIPMLNMTHHTTNMPAPLGLRK